MTTPAPDDALIAHGMDCCWGCFHGRPTHPSRDSDCGCPWDTEESTNAS